MTASHETSFSLMSYLLFHEPGIIKIHKVYNLERRAQILLNTINHSRSVIKKERQKNIDILMMEQKY